MAPKKEGEQDEDWFEQLDAQLERETEKVEKDKAELDSQKRMINKALIEDIWRIWKRFDEAKVHMIIDPAPEVFATYESYPDVWHFKNDFRFEDVKGVQIVDHTPDQNRIGDAIKAWYYLSDSTLRLRMIFEYCEGEHYYKYAGWKRIFAQFVIYDAPLNKLSMDDLHKKMGDVIKAWYESHLKKDREFVIKHLKENYERGETFTE
ncbi:MAG: hypothetical protein ABR879_02000 [Methanomassiliicoccales archaeon]|jgi:hypothetical protein